MGLVISYHTLIIDNVKASPRLLHLSNQVLAKSYSRPVSRTSDFRFRRPQHRKHLSCTPVATLECLQSLPGSAVEESNPAAWTAAGRQRDWRLVNETGQPNMLSDFAASPGSHSARLYLSITWGCRCGCGYTVLPESDPCAQARGGLGSCAFHCS